METGITEQEFAQFQTLIHARAGISLADSKQVLLVGRLHRRLRHFNLDSFGDYYRMLVGGKHPAEMQTMIDLVTTNETYFFREPKHFDFLCNEILARRQGTGNFRVWSAASSSGEEAYTIAMLLAEHLGNLPWEVFGSDLSSQVLEKAKSAQYPVERSKGIPRSLLSKYCLKGVRSQDGTFIISPAIAQRVRFDSINLIHSIDAGIGEFDVIFIRNVLIYFNPETKRNVMSNLLPRLKKGGFLIVGHSETLNGIADRLRQVRPTIYYNP